MKKEIPISQIDTRIKHWVQQKGYTSNEDLLQFFYPQKKHLSNPMLMQGMPQAVERIQKAIQQNQTIVIYGDYDCDGVCATSVLYLYLKSVGVSPQIFIPHRFENGYGLSKETIEHILTSVRPNLLVTVDCGITAVEEIETLQKHGVDVIVTDHHEPASTLPNCIIVDPKTDASASFKEFCGAGVAFKLVQALAGTEKALEYIDLVAVATIGDIVPLVNENRTIAKLGLEKLYKTPNKGLQELCISSKLQQPTATDISFKIVPKINSCGRMDTALTAFQLLTETNPHIRNKALQTMLHNNEERLQAKQTATEIADAQIATYNFNKQNGLVVVSPNIPEGILGIVASYMVNTYQKPSFVFTQDKDGNYKGSARGLEGQDLHAQLLPLPYFKALGGHKLACGMTVYKEKFQELCAYIASMPTPEQPVLPQKEYLNIQPQDISLSFAQQLELLEPCGFGNEKPLCALTTNAHTLREFKGGKHVALQLPQGKEITCFFAEPYLELLQADVEKTLYLQLAVNTYQGIPKAQAVLQEITSHSALPPTFAQAQALYMLAQNKKGNHPAHKNTQSLEQFTKQTQVNKRQCLVWGLAPEEAFAPVYNLPKSRINAQVLGYKITPESWVGYTNIFINQPYYHTNQFAFLEQWGATVTYAPTATIKPITVNTSRAFFATVFQLLQHKPSVYQNTTNLYTCAEVISKNLQQPLHHVMFTLLVFVELGILTVPSVTQPSFRVHTHKKTELSNSILYQQFM